MPVAGSESSASSGSLSSGSGWNFRRSLPTGAKKHSYQVVSAPDHPVRYGNKSERFEVRPGDCTSSEWKGGYNDCKNDRERSELIQIKYKNCSKANLCGPLQRQGDEYWYRWSIYIPKDHRNLPPVHVVYGQFHQFQFKTLKGCPPAFQLIEKTYDGGLMLAIWRSITYSGAIHWKRLLTFEEFVGKWNDIVVHARWSGGNDGWFSVWVNGDQKVDYQGKTMACEGVANSNIDTFFKYGVYRAAVSENPDSKTVTTIAYYDGVVRSKTKKGMFDPLSE